MARTPSKKFKIVPSIVKLGIDVLGLLVSALEVGGWAIIMRHFGNGYRKNDIIFTIYKIARKYHDLGNHFYHQAIIIYLRKNFRKFGGLKSLNKGA